MTAEEQARIRSYLVAQAAKLDPPALVEKVRVAMGELRAAAAKVPPARFGDRPAPGEWSANEVLAHVVVIGARFSARILDAIDGRPHGAPAMGDPEPSAPSRTLDQWWAELTRDRDALFARVLAAAPSANVEQVIEHGAFGRLNWRETLLFLRLHDLDHAGQLGKIAAALA